MLLLVIVWQLMKLFVYFCEQVHLSKTTMQYKNPYKYKIAVFDNYIVGVIL